LGAVSAAEDPEKILDQVVTEMQEDLIKMRQASAQVGTEQSAALQCCCGPRGGSSHACMQAGCGLVAKAVDGMHVCAAVCRI